MTTFGRYVLVGSGVAGFSAAEAIRENDEAADITMIGDEPHGFYSRPGLAYLLSGEISQRFLFPFDEQDYRKLNILRHRARAVRIDPAAHTLFLDDRTSLPYDRLLIVTGAEAVRPAVKGADLQGVVKLDNLDDACQILKQVGGAEAAVVVGGGITALEIVEALVARKVHTHYFLRGDRYWSNVLEEGESRLVERRLQEDGVEIHFNTELAEIVGAKGRVTGVRTKKNQLIKCKIVGIAIGIQPRKELAEASGLKTERGILVNEYLQTSAPDIYAAGDVAQVFDPLTGQYTLDSLWSTARQQGRAAGLNMSGPPFLYQKELSFNVTRLAGLTTTIIGSVGGGRDADMVGIARGDSESWRQSSDALGIQNNSDASRLRIQVGRQMLLGAVIMGDQAYSAPLEGLIANRVDITPIREKLLQPGAPIGELVTEYWYRWDESTHAA